jgi:hypothetical protein
MNIDPIATNPVSTTSFLPIPVLPTVLKCFTAPQHQLNFKSLEPSTFTLFVIFVRPRRPSRPLRLTPPSGRSGHRKARDAQLRFVIWRRGG